MLQSARFCSLTNRLRLPPRGLHKIASVIHLPETGIDLSAKDPLNGSAMVLIGSANLPEFMVSFLLNVQLWPKLEFPFSALIRREFTTGSRFCKAKLPSAVEKLSDSVPSWLPMRHREHFPSISPTLLPPHGFLVIRFAFYATSR
jgi:hypothetical protein